MHHEIRGLKNFIVELHKQCKTPRLEHARIMKEMGKIRAAFAKSKVSAYDKKKYVWKIVYMYMLGYDVDFGHQQAIELLASPKYSEKSVGYMALAIMLSEHPDLVRLCTQAFKSDLSSGDKRFACLALHCIANVGGRGLAETLGQEVLRLLCAGGTRSFVKKKAALALLRMFRAAPDLIEHDTWAPRIVSLLDQTNVGVLLSVTTLLSALATAAPGYYSIAAPKATDVLHRLSTGASVCPQGYMYYQTPSPWLQIKLMRLLQRFEVDVLTAELSGHVQNALKQTLQFVFSRTEVTKNSNKNNADHAILFEAVRLVLHLKSWFETGDPLFESAVSRLVSYLEVKEANFRFLGLSMLARLARLRGQEDPSVMRAITRHMPKIKATLHDSDISIQRRALALLFEVADAKKANEVLELLLELLEHCAFELKSELVIKIAVIAEKYQNGLSYVQTTLQLLSIAPAHVNDEVWFRAVRLVTNDESLQLAAARMCVQVLQQRAESLHENAVRFLAYMLGEFGQLVLDSNETRLGEIFDLLHEHLARVTERAQAELLSAFMKFVVIASAEDDSGTSERIRAVIARRQGALDLELQQRAVEYGVMQRMLGAHNMLG
ncbi:MAG: hypothetical protein MHM6MM_004624, partial [Cercozoa sp. M6MM]